jgi:hypothetical protein
MPKIYLFIMYNFIIHVLGELDRTEKIKFMGYEAEFIKGLTAFLLAHFMIGLLLSLYLKKAKYNLAKLPEDISESLKLYPSIFCGHKYVRLFAVTIPMLFIFKALYSGFGLYLPSIVFFLVFASSYFVALKYSYEIHT